MGRSSPRPPRRPRGPQCRRCPFSGRRPRSSSGRSTLWRARAVAGCCAWFRCTGGFAVRAPRPRTADSSRRPSRGSA
eukprot:11201310-Lingulodinium_polyedra.AAC.1